MPREDGWWNPVPGLGKERFIEPGIGIGCRSHVFSSLESLTALGLFHSGTDNGDAGTVMFANWTDSPSIISKLAVMSWFGTKRVLEEDKDRHKIGNGKHESRLSQM